MTLAQAILTLIVVIGQLIFILWFGMKAFNLIMTERELVKDFVRENKMLMFLMVLGVINIILGVMF